MLFIVDRDEKGDADVAKMLKRLGSTASLAVLPRREIENFLVVPSAVAERALGPIYPHRLSAASPEACLEEVIKDLQGKKEALANIVAEVSREIDLVWPSEATALVPGSELLDAVFRKHGLRYRKDVDSARLASLIPTGEIDEVIVQILHQAQGTNP